MAELSLAIIVINAVAAAWFFYRDWRTWQAQLVFNEIVFQRMTALNIRIYELERRQEQRREFVQ